MPTSLVIELQNLAQSGATDISELLRRAMVVAAKLKLDDFNDWLEHELNGYPPMSALPDYRNVPSRLMSCLPPNPPQPVGFFGGEVADGEVNLAEHFSKAQVRQSVAQIAHLVAPAAKDGSGALRATLNEGEMKALVAGNEEFLEVEVFRTMSPSTFVAILDAVRNRILKWSLELERKGILGDGMSFTKEEQATAASRITINGSVGSFVQGGGATVTTTQNSPGAEVRVASGTTTVNERTKIAIEGVRKLNPSAAEAIEKLAERVTSAQLPEETNAEASEALAVVAEQSALPAEQRLPKVVLTPLVSSLRDNLGLSADLLQIWSTFGPVIVGWLGLVLK